MWKRADQADPTGEASPTDDGWKLTQNCLQPDWYPGSSLPESLTRAPSVDGDSMGATSTDDESENVWSYDSDENDEDMQNTAEENC